MGTLRAAFSPLPPHSWLENQNPVLLGIHFTSPPSRPECPSLCNLNIVCDLHVICM